MTKKRKIPAKYNTASVKNAIVDLAHRGLTKGAIIRKLKLSLNFFTNYPEADELYAKGRDRLTDDVASSIIGASTTSYNDRKILAERLNLFSEPFTVKKLHTPEEARDLIAAAVDKYTRCEITADTLNIVIRAANSFIESFNQSVLMDEINELKKLFKERGDR